MDVHLSPDTFTSLDTTCALAAACLPVWALLAAWECKVMSVGPRLGAGPQIVADQYFFMYGLFNDDGSKLNDITFNDWMMAINELGDRLI